MKTPTVGNSGFPGDHFVAGMADETRLRGMRDTDGRNRSDVGDKKHSPRHLRGTTFWIAHAVFAMALAFGARWLHSPTRSSNPSAGFPPKPGREPTQSPPSALPTIETNVVTLCPPSDDGRSYRPTTPFVSSGAVMGSGEQYACEPFAENWGSTFVVATDPPSTVTCPEPDHAWHGTRRRMHVVRIGDHVSLRCSLGQIVDGMPEIETLGEWSFVLPTTGPVAPGAIEVTEPAASPASHRSAAGEYCEPTIEDLAYAPRARIHRYMLRALGGRVGTRPVPLGDTRTMTVVAVVWSHGSYSCVASVDGESGGGLVSTDSLEPIGDAQYIPAPEQLTGTWTDGSNVFAIRADSPPDDITCRAGTPLHVVGCAWWGGAERGHSGGVNNWICSGRPVLRTIGDPSDETCQVRFRWADGALQVEDNEQCGGLNVRFAGTFRRRPWHPDPEYQECDLRGRDNAEE